MFYYILNAGSFINELNGIEKGTSLRVKILVGLDGIYLLYVIFGFFIVQIIVIKALEGNVAEMLDWTITLEKATLFERDDFHLDSSWLDRSAWDRANRAKGSLTTTHGIRASRKFLSGEAFIDPASVESLAKFDLTD